MLIHNEWMDVESTSNHTNFVFLFWSFFWLSVDGCRIDFEPYQLFFCFFLVFYCCLRRWHEWGSTTMSSCSLPYKLLERSVWTWHPGFPIRRDSWSPITCIHIQELFRINGSWKVATNRTRTATSIQYLRTCLGWRCDSFRMSKRIILFITRN